MTENLRDKAWICADLFAQGLSKRSKLDYILSQMTYVKPRSNMRLSYLQMDFIIGRRRLWSARSCLSLKIVPQNSGHCNNIQQLLGTTCIMTLPLASISMKTHLYLQKWLQNRVSQLLHHSKVLRQECVDECWIWLPPRANTHGSLQHPCSTQTRIVSIHSCQALSIQPISLQHCITL